MYETQSTLCASESNPCDLLGTSRADHRRMNLRQDFHVHSTFSDGKGTLQENLAVATAKGLRELGCVDHVRRDTLWVPEYVAAVAALRATTDIKISCGVEAKMLNCAGELDIPDLLAGVDHIYIADHQMPFGNTCLGPREVRELMIKNALTPSDVILALITATSNALRRHRNAVIAHLFSFLPKVGIDESQVPEAQIVGLANVAVQHQAILEFDERWQCPGPRVKAIFAAHNVPMVASSDAHRPEEIGAYQWMPTLYDVAITP